VTYKYKEHIDGICICVVLQNMVGIREVLGEGEVCKNLKGGMKKGSLSK
jgi:hypothetical protein